MVGPVNTLFFLPPADPSHEKPAAQAATDNASHRPAWQDKKEGAGRAEGQPGPHFAKELRPGSGFFFFHNNYVEI